MISPHRSGAVTNRNGFALNDTLKSSDASAVNMVVTPQPGAFEACQTSEHTW